MVKVFLLTLTLLFCLNVQAANKINVIGAGNDSCGKWLNNRKTQSDWHQAGQWMSGYYVAAKGLLSEDKIYLKDVDTYAVMSFVDKYCTENPLDAIFDAMNPLLLNLVIKK